MLSVATPAASGLDSANKSSETSFHRSEKSSACDGQTSVAHGQEFSLTLRPLPGENITALFTRMGDALGGATILNLLMFGSVDGSATAKAALRRVFGKVDWPITWVDGSACYGGPIAGVQVTAIEGRSVRRIRLDGRVVGSVFEEGGARHCLLGGLGPKKHFVSPADQTKQTLERLEIALIHAGFSLADTVRTWFFLENILSWYDEFNAARTQIYSGIKFRTGSMPASMGVGARNPARAALAVAARAMKPLEAQASAIETASPLQCPAPAYGSSFSRAMEVTTGNTRRLFISGTASIAPGGETVWRNDVQRQVELSMKVVEAILHSRGFSFNDLTRAVAYFRHPAEAFAFAKWSATQNLASLPVVLAHCDICRDDLLFELEADACKSTG